MTTENYNSAVNEDPQIWEYENLREKPQYFDVDTPVPDNLKYNDIPCYLNYNNNKRYMYQAIPPARNSSTDLRNNPVWIKPVDNNLFGIFQHTGIYGNNRDIRQCKYTSNANNDQNGII